MKSVICLTLLIALTLLPESSAVDCFGWSYTKRVRYLEVLPMLLYYDKVNWINLDPSRTCTFKTHEALFLKLYTSDITATYQPYKEVGVKCQLDTNTTAKPFTNSTWIYSNHILQPSPDTCGYLVTLTNSNTTTTSMFQVIRTNAVKLFATISAVAVVGLNLL